jgi:hypothetical protein
LALTSTQTSPTLYSIGAKRRGSCRPGDG